MARFLAGKHKRGMRNPLGWIAGCCGAGRGGLADMGGSAAVLSPAGYFTTAHGWGSPELSKVGRPGLVWLGFWPGSTSAGCATHWGG